MKHLIGILAFALVISPALGFVIYDTNIENEVAHTNVTIGLDSETSVNYWNLEFLLPENSQILSMKDTKGPITQYSTLGRTVAIKTNTGPQRTTEIITISILTGNVIDESYSPLKVAKLSYSGFESESTAVNIRSDEKIITSNVPFGFSIEKSGNSLKLSGKGPVNAIFTLGNSGIETENYVVFGNGNISEAQRLNQIVPRIIGIIPYYNKFPVAVLPDSEYNEQLDGFSAGTYKTGGIILIPESKTGKKETASIILHETVHGYNDQIFRWSNARVGWFDEGTATYAAWVANQLTGTRQPEIFGDPVEYVEGFVKYTIPPEGNREDLWEYYQQNRDDMKTWASHGPQDAETRRFGYAFSQLMIRHYVYNNGADALHTLYSQLSKVDRQVTDPEEYNRIVLDAMGSDMKPCYSTDREQFDRCLDRINDMKAEVPTSQVVKETYGSQIDTEKLLNETYTKVKEEEESFSISKLLFKISESIERFVKWLDGLFR